MDILVTYLIKEPEKPSKCFRFALGEVERKTLEVLLSERGVYNFTVLKREIDLNSDEEEI